MKPKKQLSCFGARNLVPPMVEASNTQVAAIGRGYIRLLLPYDITVIKEFTRQFFKQVHYMAENKLV